MSADAASSPAPALPASPAAVRRAAARESLPFAAASVLTGLSFGVAALAAGMPAAAAIAMSAVVYAGAAQFAAVAILGQGGSVAAAVLAAALMNARYLAMGLAIGPWLHGGRLQRALEGQAVVDAAWALANDGDGRFDRDRLFGSSLPQYVGWLGGTILGVIAGGVLPDPEALGIDAVFPAFFLALLAAELRSGQAGLVAAGGAAVALVLALVAPPGVGIIAAALVALVGLRGSPRA